MDSRVRGIATSRQLRARAREWLKLFGLTDWTVEVSFVRGDSEQLTGTRNGTVMTLPERKTAAIYICRPSDMDDGESIEQVLVHELLHLFFAVLPTRSSELQRITEEQAVDRLATVLVALRR